MRRKRIRREIYLSNDSEQYKNCVYRFINKTGEIIYVGKAKSLHRRIYKQHFGLNGEGHLPKECYHEVERIEYISFKTEGEASLAESYFISKVKPKFNQMLKNREISFGISFFENMYWKPYVYKKHYVDDYFRLIKNKNYENCIVVDIFTGKKYKYIDELESDFEDGLRNGWSWIHRSCNYTSIAGVGGYRNDNNENGLCAFMYIEKYILYSKEEIENIKKAIIKREKFERQEFERSRLSWTEKC